MPDRENVIKGLIDIGGFIAGRVGFEQARNFLRTIDDALALLKDQEAQKQSILKNIADNQLANSPDEWQSPEQQMYSKGVFDGLQIAYEMLAYGVVKKDA